LDPIAAARFFSKSSGSPMCARFGYPLGRPGATPAQDRRTAEHIATGCDSHGLSKPGRPIEIKTEVALPDPEAMVELDALNPGRSLVRTCGQCVNFITEEAVEEAWGWTAGMCAAKGRLILGSRKVDEAKNCQYRAPGRNRTTALPSILPAWNDASTSDFDPIAAFKDGKGPIDPLDYATDREVTEDEAEAGIKAWRKLVDPEGSGNSVMLPIFDPKTFTPDQEDLIPKTGDQEHPELYVDHNGAVYRIAILWMELDETPAAWGQPGVGKTEVARHLAWLMQVPFYRFSIKESTEVAELEGSKEFDPERGTWFRDGRFTLAWQQICVIVVDEPNLGRSEVWAYLRPCFDNSKQMVIDADGGRHATRNGYCFPMVAMNPAWSPLNIGAAQIGAADASRLMHIEFSLPEESVERSIIQNRIRLDGWEIDRVRLDLVITVSTSIRELCEDGTLSMTWGIRENLKVARALRWFTPLIAYRMAAGDYLEPSQQAILLDQVRARMGAKLPPVDIIEES
jgi:hypothetical protein